MQAIVPATRYKQKARVHRPVARYVKIEVAAAATEDDKIYLEFTADGYRYSAEINNKCADALAETLIYWAKEVRKDL